MMTATLNSSSDATLSDVRRITAAINARQRFVISSHSRPDGDSIGSQLAMAFALRALGKEVTVINSDPAPPALMAFPGVSDIVIAPRAEGQFDAAIIMECGDLARTGVTALDQYFVINIDHHPGNTGYGQINWFDPSAAACAELVYDVVATLEVPLSREIATHVYLAILTDTGSFHYSGLSPRTFEICASALRAGVDPVRVARTVYDSNSVGKLRLLGAVMNTMQVESSGCIATLYLDEAMAASTGGSYEDTDGIINIPLTVKDIQAVVFIKHTGVDEYRVSLRSKGSIDIGAIAREFGGGGHKNAAGCTVHGRRDAVQDLLIAKIAAAIEADSARVP